MPKLVLTAAALGVMTLAGCGSTDLQRAGTGAAGGAVAGELIANDPLTGAALGGVGGALADDI